MTRSDPQAEVVSFLLRPESWSGLEPTVADRVDTIETHGARVFLAGDTALKMRRIISLPYLDFSTLDARERFARREIELNQPAAPDLYLGVVPVVRASDGRLSLGGAGEVVEWCVHMRRFDQRLLLSHIAGAEGISERLAEQLADLAVASHGAAARVERGADWTADALAYDARDVVAALRSCSDLRIAATARHVGDEIMRAVGSTAELRRRRADTGHVRRCHGDLHLGNIVLWNGRPVPFDALEFDERLATTDTLYDLAFMLMDIRRQAGPGAANAVLNRYLWRTGDPLDLEGLAALPLFLALRAAVRAMVALDRAEVGAEPERVCFDRAAETLRQAAELIRPGPLHLIAVGGLSGTGKTTLAKGLAPMIGSAPGALHLRTDLERKWIAGVGALVRLPASAYTPQSSAEVYSRVMSRAGLALAAGHSVVVDAVCSTVEERVALAGLAHRSGARFDGLWLEAPLDTIKGRVARRSGDASDATPLVVEQQAARPAGPIDWIRIDAGQTGSEVAAAARRALGLS
jgi:aminoglycoside phosphotransferase family enzyme/predicted kinase